MAVATKESVIDALQKRLPRSESSSFALLNVPVADVMTANVEAVKLLEAEGFSGVYVSLSKDYLSISTMLADEGVDLRKVKFVDAISRMYGIAPVESEEVVYVDGPLSGEALLEGIAASVRTLKAEKRFVLLDSLTIVMLYNTLEATVEFGKLLRSLLKKERVVGVVVVAYTDSVNQEVIGRITKSDDEVVSVGA